MSFLIDSLLIEMIIVPRSLLFQDRMCRCVVVPTWNSSNSIESIMSGCGCVTIPSVGWNCLSLRGTVCEVVWIYVFVDVSNVYSPCFKSRMSGLPNAGFILLILLVSLLIRCRSFLGSGKFTFAAVAAVVAVYGSGECCRMSLSTFVVRMLPYL